MPKKVINLNPQIASPLSNLFGKQDMSDVTLVVVDNDQQKEFPAHRVKIIQFPFFRKIVFNNQFMEANENRIFIKAPVDAFEKVLKFMYTATIEVDDEKIVEFLEILDLAQRFGLENLEDSLLWEAVSWINSENILILLRLAKILNADFLEEKCLEFIDKILTEPGNKLNTKTAKEEEELEEIPKPETNFFLKFVYFVTNLCKELILSIFLIVFLFIIFDVTFSFLEQ